MIISFVNIVHSFGRTSVTSRLPKTVTEHLVCRMTSSRNYFAIRRIIAFFEHIIIVRFVADINHLLLMYRVLSVKETKWFLLVWSDGRAES